MTKRVHKALEKKPKEHLMDVLNGVAPIAASNLQKLLNAFDIIDFEKNTQVIKEGEISDYLYFISKGIVRVYYYNAGKEIIDWFAEEGSFFGNMYSHITQKPGFDIYETIEDVTLLRIKYSHLERLFAESHEIESIARQLMQRYYINYIERVHSIKGFTANEKYSLFKKNHSTFVNRIPLKYVANYLDITSETLSRIRAKENKKNKLIDK